MRRKLTVESFDRNCGIVINGYRVLHIVPACFMIVGGIMWSTFAIYYNATQYSNANHTNVTHAPTTRPNADINDGLIVPQLMFAFGVFISLCVILSNLCCPRKIDREATAATALLPVTNTTNFFGQPSSPARIDMNQIQTVYDYSAV